MSQKASPAAVGAFVLGAAALSVAAVLFFGSGVLRQQQDRYVVYFEGSVVGLDRGAPVMFRGVPVGKVGDIKGRFYAEDVSIQIAVYIDLVDGSLDVVGDAPDELEGGSAIQALVERGMRAQLSVQSLVTGKSFVALLMAPEKEAVYRAPSDEAYQEVPSIPTQLEQVEATVRTLAKRLGDLQLESLVADFGEMLQSANELLEDPNLRAAVGELDETIVAFRRVAESADEQVTPVGESVTAAAKEAKLALARMEIVLDDLAQAYAGGSPIQHEAIRAMQQVNEAARAVRQLSETLTNQPDSIIFGRRVEDSQ